MLRGEYRYADYSSDKLSATFLNGVSPIDSLNATISVKTHTAYVGLSHLFNYRR